jgi:hypothetical protein
LRAATNLTCPGNTAAISTPSTCCGHQQPAILCWQKGMRLQCHLFEKFSTHHRTRRAVLVSAANLPTLSVQDSPNVMPLQSPTQGETNSTQRRSCRDLSSSIAKYVLSASDLKVCICQSSLAREKEEHRKRARKVFFSG